MRIAFLCTSNLDYPSPRGRWLPVARQLAHAGHTPQLLMLHPTFDRLGRERVERIDGVACRSVGQMHVYGLPGQRRALGALELLAVSLRSAAALAAAAVRVRPEVIVVAKPQPINGLAALLAQRIVGGGLHVDCDDYEAGANRFAGAWQRRVVTWWEDTLPRRAAWVSVNTHFLRERLAGLGIREQRLTYVPNGVDAAQFVQPPATHTSALRTALGLGDAPTLLYLGSMSMVAHGTGLLLEAFALAQRRLPAARLVMVGDGDDRPALQAAAHDHRMTGAIVWAGRVPAQAAPALLALGDASVDPVFAMPAMAARSPLKVVESMAQGIPVVTSAVGDRRLMLGDTGVLVTPGDAGALADGIVALLGNREQARALGRAARHRAAMFRWEAVAAPWLGLYARA